MSTYKAIMRLLVHINEKIGCLNSNIENLIAYMTKPATIEQEKKKLLLNLPSHLLKTYFTLETLEKASTSDISTLTHKARAVESKNLNELARLGLIYKRRKGRMAIFEVEKQ